MKITKQNNYIYSNNQPKRSSFRGQIAAPIKELHIPADYSPKFKPFLEELNQKCGKYFKIIVQTSEGLVADFNKLNFTSTGYLEEALGFKWGQDNKIFLGKDKLGVFTKSQSYSGVAELAQNLGLEKKYIDLNIEGGNCFLGKKQNGEDFALVGKNALKSTTKEKFADVLEINKKNLHVISQPDFHIDLGIRPLVYPYVLVGDPKLTIDLAMKNNFEKSQIDFLKRANKFWLKAESNEKYSTPDEVIRELKSQGFKTIKVPGLLASDPRLNFMNALVHQNDNGDLIYITNKTNVGARFGIDFENIFEKHLKSKVPSVKEILFIEGDGFVQGSLCNGGGIHCLSAERIDHEKWSFLLNNNNKKS